MNRLNTRPGYYRVDTRRQITIEGPFRRAPGPIRSAIFTVLTVLFCVLVLAPLIALVVFQVAQ
ncbi:hypothetical protein SAMN05216344_106100 [Polaromonas sp. OV174]|uniref:hypothetical protein n=1 Tax=Polaromonas sp. OV174 TaxID=1855300 RepID=UPI0008EAC002|nr:hypothetical protein [Polaromonas sp. OV174]SFB96119.1 hypothetical protein SAMN05216344_106100 [Polaromonas sp. OV174]